MSLSSHCASVSEKRVEVVIVMKGSHLQVFGLSVNQQLHIERLLFSCSTGDDLLLRCGRHLRPQLQQSSTETLTTRGEKRCQLQ